MNANMQTTATYVDAIDDGVTYSTVLYQGQQFEFLYHPSEKQLEGWAIGSLYSRRVPFNHEFDEYDSAITKLIDRIQGAL